jgi:hypothetical protein
MSRLPVAVLVLVLGSLLLTAIRPVWTIDPDAGLYVGLGRALAAGDGYALDGVPHTKYPPGLPCLLSLLIRLRGPEAYALFHAVLVLAVLGAVALSFAVVRALRLQTPVALAVAAATGFSQSLFDLSVQYVRTEALFLALTLGALVAFWRSRREEAGWGWTLVAAALMAAATLTRLAGVSLLVVPLAAQLRRGLPAGRRLRLLVPALATLAVLVAWQARAASLASLDPRSVDYGAEFLAAEPRDLTKTIRLDMPRLDGPALAHRLAGNLEVMARAMPVLILNVDRAGARLPVGLAMLGLVLLGLLALLGARDATPERREAALYVLATLGMYLLWPFNQQERFYLPLLPLLLVAAGFGTLTLLNLARRAWARPAARRAALLAGAALILLLAAQRSDHPTLLGRWSTSYALLLGLATAGWILAARSRTVLAPRPGLALAFAAAVALPFAHKRFVEWPARVERFRERRAAQPQTGALASVDVDPVLEEVALYLRDHTPPQAVLMTDVPSILATLSGRRCIPFVYAMNPPRVETDGADFVFYTRELPDASLAMDAAAAGLRPARELEPIDLGDRMIRPTIYATGR